MATSVEFYFNNTTKKRQRLSTIITQLRLKNCEKTQKNVGWQ
ncbi:hypothetical protein HMPREF1546_00172 [Oscillibacter sp. KLE 1745]|nr:hypothetical protein HMPREF1546_00172 [Oscillibacter sp. KLE 1745]